MFSYSNYVEYYVVTSIWRYAVYRTMKKEPSIKDIADKYVFPVLIGINVAMFVLFIVFAFAGVYGWNAGIAIMSWHGVMTMI